MIKTLRELTKNINLVVFNNVTDVSELNTEIERELKENENHIEYYQYYAVWKLDGEYLAEKAPDYFSLFYSEECDLHILGVQIADSWENYSIEI